MATQIIKWKPGTGPNVIAYEILSSDTGRDGEYTTLAQVLHQIPGANYDDTGGFFYYTDTEVPYRYYRLRILDRYGNVAEDEVPTPFQAGNDPIEVPTLHFVALTADTTGSNNLQYVSQGGTPIEGATIRVYRKIDWDTNQLSKVVGSTVTTSAGTWMNPVFVEPGETYTIVYTKANEYGPNTVEVTV